jgi:hypothetical protein
MASIKHCIWCQLSNNFMYNGYNLTQLNKIKLLNGFQEMSAFLKK